MSVITTYLNDNAQTPLGRFVIYTLYTNFATNTVTNRTDRAYALLSVSQLYRRPSKVRETARSRNFVLSHNCADKNGSREQSHSLFGVICHSFHNS